MPELLALFLSFLQIGVLSIGGGYAAMPIIKSQIVDTHAWLTAEEFAEMVTIAEMTPGPVALNAASFVGGRIAGVGGSLLATLGCILPSCILITVLFLLYRRFKQAEVFRRILTGIRPVVIGLVCAAAYGMVVPTIYRPDMTLSLKGIHIPSICLAVLAFVLLRKTKISPTIILYSAGGVGILLYLVSLWAGVV